VKFADETTDVPCGLVVPRQWLRAAAFDVRQLLVAVRGEAVTDRARRCLESAISEMTKQADDSLALRSTPSDDYISEPPDLCLRAALKALAIRVLRHSQSLAPSLLD
jgi:hypothetical protein